MTKQGPVRPKWTKTDQVVNDRSRMSAVVRRGASDKIGCNASERPVLSRATRSATNQQHRRKCLLGLPATADASRYPMRCAALRGMKGHLNRQAPVDTATVLFGSPQRLSDGLIWTRWRY